MTNEERANARAEILRVATKLQEGHRDLDCRLFASTVMDYLRGELGGRSRPGHGARGQKPPIERQIRAAPWPPPRSAGREFSVRP